MWQGAIDRAIGEKSGYEVEFESSSRRHGQIYPHRRPSCFGRIRGFGEFVGSATDIHRPKTSRGAAGGEKRLLEMIARGDSRALILEGACLLVEELASGSLCSILFLDSSTSCLRHGAAPSLPTTYTKAIDGAVVGPFVGSRGTVAYRAEPLIVSDIATDPAMGRFSRSKRSRTGYERAGPRRYFPQQGRCWGPLRPTIASRTAPTPQEDNVIERITHLASIAIERKAGGREAAAKRGLLAEAQRMTRSGSWAWNVRTGAVFWSQETFRIYECDPRENYPQLAALCSSPDRSPGGPFREMTANWG